MAGSLDGLLLGLSFDAISHDENYLFWRPFLPEGMTISEASATTESFGFGLELLSSLLFTAVARSFSFSWFRESRRQLGYEGTNWVIVIE